MKNSTFAAVAIAMAVTGCARLSTTQLDETLDAKGNVVGRKTTKVRAMAVFDSQNDLNKFHTTATDKTQGISIGTLGQAASSSNGVVIMDKALKMLQILTVP